MFRPPSPHQAASPNSFLSVSLVEDHSACAARCAPNTLGCGIEPSSPHPLLPPVRFTHGAQGPVASSLSTLYSAPCAHHQPRQAAAANSFLSVSRVEAAPPVLLAALPTPPAEESKRIHRRHFHLSASLTGHKVRSQAPSPPCTPLPAPTQRHQVASANSLLSSVYWFPVLGGPLCGAENMRPTQSRKHVEGG